MPLGLGLEVRVELSPQPCHSPAGGAWGSHLPEFSPVCQAGTRAASASRPAVRDATEHSAQSLAQCKHSNTDHPKDDDLRMLSKSQVMFSLDTDPRLLTPD